MVKNITNTTQLDFFDTLKSVLKKSSILSRKLRDDDYYEYEPNLQSLSFKQLPYIALVNETTTTTKQTIRSKSTIKSFTEEFVLVMDYQARYKFRDYASSIIRTIEDNQSDFESIGCYDITVDLSSRTPEMVNNKQVITGTFTIEYTGVVER